MFIWGFDSLRIAIGIKKLSVFNDLYNVPILIFVITTLRFDEEKKFEVCRPTFHLTIRMEKKSLTTYDSKQQVMLTVIIGENISRKVIYVLHTACKQSE